MGFSSVCTALRSAMLSDALGWAQDFSPLIGAVVGLMLFGLAMQIVRKFI